MSRVKVEVKVTEGAEWPFDEAVPFTFELKAAEVQVMLMAKRVRIDSVWCRIVDSEAVLDIRPSWSGEPTHVGWVDITVEAII